MSTRRAALRVPLGCALAAVLPPAAMAQPAGGAMWLPRPASLAAALDKALGLRKALVTMVSLEGCPYCKLVREGHLKPLLAEGQPVVQIELADAIPLADFRGRPSTHAQVVRDFGIRIAPTVLFVGRGGVEAAPRLTGIASADFYGAYLQERVEAANRAVAA